MKKLAMLLAALLLLSLMAGCSTEPVAPSTPDVPATVTPNENPDEPSGEAVDSPEEPSEKPADVADTTTDESWLPLVDEPVEFTIWGVHRGFQDIDPDATLEDTPFAKYVTEATGVNLKWTIVSSGNEQFSLMLISGDYQDIISQWVDAYPSGVGYAIDEEILIDIAPYIEAGYAPHYQAVREADKNVYMDTQLDDGRVCGFFRVLESYQPTWAGPIIAEEWVAKAGYTLDELVSLNDWHDMMLTLSQTEGVSVAMEAARSGFDYNFLSAYDIPAGSLYDKYFRHVGDQVEYNFNSQDFYNYLTTMKTWYDEGIFDSNFYGATGGIAMANQDLVAEGGVVCMSANGSSIPLLNKLSGLSYRGIAAPLQEGRTARNVSMIHGVYSRVEMLAWSITTACKDPELATRYIDYYFSDEAFLPINYGIEGVCYTLNEDGEPVFTDLMVRNPDGLRFTTLQGYYGGFGFAPGRYEWKAQYSNVDPAVVETTYVWDKNWSRDTDLYTLPTLALTREESERFSNTYNDIQTYVEEMTLKFIIGDEELSEKSYAAYCNDIAEMRIDECIDIVQTSYERYLQR